MSEGMLCSGVTQRNCSGWCAGCDNEENTLMGQEVEEVQKTSLRICLILEVAVHAHFWPKHQHSAEQSIFACFANVKAKSVHKLPLQT